MFQVHIETTLAVAVYMALGIVLRSIGYGQGALESDVVWLFQRRCHRRAGGRI